MRLDKLREAVARQIDAVDPTAECRAQGLSEFQTGALVSSKAFNAIRSGAYVGTRKSRRHVTKRRIVPPAAKA